MGKFKGAEGRTRWWCYGGNPGTCYQETYLGNCLENELHSSISCQFGKKLLRCSWLLWFSLWAQTPATIWTLSHVGQWVLSYLVSYLTCSSLFLSVLTLTTRILRPSANVQQLPYETPSSVDPDFYSDRPLIQIHTKYSQLFLFLWIVPWEMR